MFDFSGDEGFFFILASFVSVRCTVAWCSLASIPKSNRKGHAHLFLTGILVFCIALTILVLQAWGDLSVKGHPDYLLLFVVGAAAWFFVSAFLMQLLGLSIRNDAIEQNNPAAAIACGGGLAAVGIAYAASNVGGGPTIWTTLLPAAAATGCLGLIWIIIDAMGASVVDRVAIDRDAAAAINMAGALIGASLILGRAAGGDWVSWDQTWGDFISRGWPAILLAVSAGLVLRRFRPTPECPQPSIRECGLIPAACYVAAAVGVVAMTSYGLDPSRW